MPSKLLVISGPTASGKTNIAASIAKEYEGELISADSRQVYLGMDIGTGKDHPKDVDVHLTDIKKPNQIFSVAQYQELAFSKIEEIHNRNKLPILVGGTGQYIDSIINPNKETFSIKPNWELRNLLSKLPVNHLQQILNLVTPDVYRKLNSSDVANPRRLIRKIEIFTAGGSHKVYSDYPKYDILHLSLTAPSQFLYKRIDNRIDQRLKSGLLDEIKALLKKYDWSDPGLNTLAYKEFKEYFDHPFSEVLEKCIDRWKFDEHAYARRQKTWFKKMEPKKSVEISKKDHQNQIINWFLEWYN